MLYIGALLNPRIRPTVMRSHCAGTAVVQACAATADTVDGVVLVSLSLAHTVMSFTSARAARYKNGYN